MSVKKHYQKRNQELNKDLMKRWGYALPEEPIDEGVFDRLKNPSRIRRRNKKLGKEVDIPTGKEVEVGSASKAESDIPVDAEKLKAFMGDYLINLEKAGIGKDTDLYMKVQKSLKDSFIALDQAQTPEAIEKAQEQPSSSP